MVRKFDFFCFCLDLSDQLSSVSVRYISEAYSGQCFLGTDQGSIHIDTGISQTVKDADKIRMTKNILGEGQVETTLTAEKSIGLKQNTTNIWEKLEFFKQQLCDFGFEKKNFSKMSVFYLNQGYQSDKNNKKVFYGDYFVFGQVNQCLNPPEDLNTYEFKKNGSKVFCHVTGQFLGLYETMGYLGLW